jgi:hypothetical protein
MRANHRSTADVQRRTDPFIHAQRLGAYRSAYDVDNRVNRTDFVEMDFFNVRIVNFGFRRSQGFKGFDSPILCRLADARA